MTLVNVEWYERLSREKIANAFGEDYNKGRWDTGIVRLPQATVLFVTFEKSGEHPFDPGVFVYHYGDRFLANDLLLWQSQLTMMQEGKIAKRVLEIGEDRVPTVLFARRCEKTGGKTETFTYCGPVTPLYSYGERPITAIWRLNHPLPESVLGGLCPNWGPCRQTDVDENNLPSERGSRAR